MKNKQINKLAHDYCCNDMSCCISDGYIRFHEKGKYAKYSIPRDLLRVFIRFCPFCSKELCEPREVPKPKYKIGDVVVYKTNDGLPSKIKESECIMGNISSASLFGIDTWIYYITAQGNCYGGDHIYEENILYKLD